MINFFSKAGGCSELTMEPVTSVWRSRSAANGGIRLGSLPPLVLEVID
jgi:hypothetical protein